MTYSGLRTCPFCGGQRISISFDNQYGTIKCDFEGCGCSLRIPLEQLGHIPIDGICARWGYDDNKQTGGMFVVPSDNTLSSDPSPTGSVTSSSLPDGESTTSVYGGWTERMERFFRSLFRPHVR